MLTRAREKFQSRNLLRGALGGLLVALGWHLIQSGAVAQPTPAAIVLEVDGAIGPATADYLSRGLELAAERDAPIVVLRLDTPGGLDSSMRDIIRNILASPVPVATFVGPSGARAASAGTYILYASHIAAMAPGTNLGAATPVAIGGALPFFGDREQDGEASEENGNAADRSERPGPQNAMEAKTINDAVSYIRSLAQLRGRNVEWAEMAVRDAATLSASEALDQNVIEVVGYSIDDVLTNIHGRTVMVGETERILNTNGLLLDIIEPDWRTRALGVITNPSVAMILMMIGIYGLFFEFLNPGSLYPGTIGAVCLLVALYALAALPLNYAGLALIILGFALIIAEAFSPSFGILGIGGTISFILGATFFIDTNAPGFEVPWGVIGSLAVTSFAFTLLVGRLAASSFGRKVVSGREEMIGLTGYVLDWSGSRGHVLVHSERWRATAGSNLNPGQTILVTALDDLTLTVEPSSTQTSAT